MIDALSRLAQVAAMQDPVFPGFDILATRSAPANASAAAAVILRAGIRSPTSRSPLTRRSCGSPLFVSTSCLHSLTPRSTSGFTLIEILVVVVILGILAAIVVPRVMERPAEARIVRVKQDLQGVATALSMYKLDNHRYPSSEQGLQALVAKPSGSPEAPNWKGPYLDRLPKDPWDHPYQYQQPGQHGDVDIYSYGADGRPGGDGDDADIGNWDN